MRELDARIAARGDERERLERRRDDLERGAAESRVRLDADLVAFEDLRRDVARCDEAAAMLQAQFQGAEQDVRGARAAVDAIRQEAVQLEVASATAESDLAHLAVACQEALQMTLEEVAAAVAADRRRGPPDGRLAGVG